ncbi:hypothetical protein LBMAG18_06750 [Alphaproteobacteria bacterium]|nr:hypothetical protein LBMAG18_06750 [Alphaproteobacteria bacterium]
MIELSAVILIIGILVAGVTQSSRLVRQIRLATTRSLTTSSPVTSIKNLSLWHEPVMDSSFIPAKSQDNSLVSAWYDINPQVTTQLRLSAT